MPAPSSNFYAEWRAQNDARLLQERGTTEPSERLLQAVWHHQRLLRDALHTTDRKPVRILHPGFWNREAGPDFKGAAVQFGTDAPRFGDIEIDLTPSCWKAHNHDTNPAFQNVILHVVWNGETSVSGLPVLALEKYLDAPLSEIRSWFTSDAAQSWPENLSGDCCASLRNLPSEQAQDLLHQAAQVRFESKARAFEARARQCGWEQALWEGMFRGLGYKQNIWPMQRLAELGRELRVPGESIVALQARLLGISGLLPDEMPVDRANPDPYLRTLWDHWWRERDKYHDALLPKSIWRFNGLRPANQPQRRLALTAHWLADENLLCRLEQWFTGSVRPGALVDSLLCCLQPAKDDFWSAHWSFRSPNLPKPQPLLGSSRVTDLAVNVVLPWFWMRAHAGKNSKLEKVAQDRYFDWPMAQDNAVLRLARQRLFGHGVLRWLKTAAAQQGLLQIVRDCCSNSNSTCAQCAFPDLVRGWEATLKMSNTVK